MTDIPDDEQKILAEMPLHAITAVYGEQGLRARLAIETGRLDDAAGRQKISEALELAGRLHAADRRQREPYINHLLRVALRIICHYGVRDTDIICAALLHDAVEDHASDLAATGGRPGALAVLAARFGPQAAALVEAVTNPVYLPGQDADEQYRAHVAASLAASPGARVIKVSDFTDNGVGIIHTTGPKAVRLASQVRPARARARRPDRPPGHTSHAARQDPHPRPAAHRSATLRGHRPAGGRRAFNVRATVSRPITGSRCPSGHSRTVDD